LNRISGRKSGKFYEVPQIFILCVPFSGNFYREIKIRKFRKQVRIYSMWNFFEFFFRNKPGIFPAAERSPTGRFRIFPRKKTGIWF